MQIVLAAAMLQLVEGTVVPYLVPVVLGALTALVGWGVKHGVAWVQAHTANVKFQGAVAHVGQLVIDMVASAEQSARPTLVAQAGNILNGKLTPAAAQVLKGDVLDSVKASAGEALPVIQEFLGLSESALEDWLSHKIEAAVAALPPSAPVEAKS